MDNAEVTTKEWLFEQEKQYNIRNANDPNFIAVWWHIDDVKSRANDIGESVTDEEAREILGQVRHGHDCNYGITWETFDYYIEEMIKKRESK
jgi:hypothetical protein